MILTLIQSTHSNLSSITCTHLSVYLVLHNLSLFVCPHHSQDTEQFHHCKNLLFCPFITIRTSLWQPSPEPKLLSPDNCKLLTISMILSFKISSINGIILYITFGDWLFYLAWLPGDIFFLLIYFSVCILFFFITSISLLRFSIFSFVSSMFIIAHWNIFIMASLTSLSDNSNIWFISVLASFDCLFLLKLFSWFFVWQVIFKCILEILAIVLGKSAAAAAAKSLQSCPTLCDPIDSSPLGSSVPGIVQARILEWVAISFSNAWKWKVKVKSLSHVQLSATPWTAAHQAPLSMGLSRQEYWSGVPLPSPI